MTILGMSLPVMKIEQEYRLIYDELQCKVTVKSDNMNPIKINVKTNFYQEDDDENVKIKMISEEIDGIYIPETIINLLLDNFDKVLKKIF